MGPAEDGKHEFYSEFLDSSQQKPGHSILLVVLEGSCCLVTTPDSEAIEKQNQES